MFHQTFLLIIIKSAYKPYGNNGFGAYYVLIFVLRNKLNFKTEMNMDISKKDLLEMNIVDIYD